MHLASQLAIANERLRALSYVDGLTGVANRRRFDEGVRAANKKGKPVSLVLIDLDHFKRLNDSRGHQDGDEALRTVATLLTERTEPRGGLAARFGGEEFAWLRAGTPRPPRPKRSARACAKPPSATTGVDSHVGRAELGV